MKEKDSKSPVSSFALFDKSSQIVRRNLKVFAMLYIIPLLQTIGSWSDKRSKETDTFTNPFAGSPASVVAVIVGFGIIFALVGLTLFWLYQTMIFAAETEASKGGKVTFSHLWQMAKKYALRLLGLVIVISLLIFGGLLLLIVPGFIMVRRYILAPYAMIDKDLTIRQAMEYSAKISKPYSGYVWGVIGVSILIALTGVIPLIGGLIALVLGMLYSVALALRYRELKQLHK